MNLQGFRHSGAGRNSSECKNVDPGFRRGVGKTSGPFGAAFVKSQGTEPFAMDGGFMPVPAVGTSRQNILAGTLTEAAIRDDRTYRA